MRLFNYKIYLTLFLFTLLYIFTPYSIARYNNNLPVIGKISPIQQINKGESVVIYATDIFDSDKIARVWAVIEYPKQTDNSDHTSKETKTIELKNQNDQSNRFEAIYDDFNLLGTYNISIYASDWIGNTSLPEFTRIIVSSEKKSKAIIIACGDINHYKWPATAKSATRAWNVFKQKNYLNDDIMLISSQEISGISQKSVLPSIENIRYAIKRWPGNNTKNLFIYIVSQALNKRLIITKNEYINAIDIQYWLNDLQANENTSPDNIIIIIDTPFSGSFIKPFSSFENKNNIIVTSSKDYETNYSFSNGEMVFSRFFWQNIGNGFSVKNAFLEAEKVLSWDEIKQTPQLEANNNGVFNEQDDKYIASNIHIKYRTNTDYNFPELLLYPESQEIENSDYTITVSLQTTTYWIEEIFAIILRPDLNQYNNKLNELSYNPFTYDPINNKYILTKNNIAYSGNYKISVHAITDDGLVSDAIYANVLSNGNLKDPYEDDNTFETAANIYLSSLKIINDQSLVINNKQFHNFHNKYDVDYVKFYAQKGKRCKIQVNDVGENCNPMIEIFDTDGKSLLFNVKNQPINWNGYGSEEYAEWDNTTSGFYYAKISHYISKNEDENNINYASKTKYTLIYYIPELDLNSLVRVIISPPINNAFIKTDIGVTCDKIIQGIFFFRHPAGKFTISISANGFYDYFREITIPKFEEDILRLEITLDPIPEAPTANFTATNISGFSPLTVSFVNESLNSNSWFWNFGDGSDESDLKNPIHVYNKPGVYRPTLRAFGEGGEHEKIMQDTIDVQWPLPVADFEMSLSSGIAPLLINFFDKSQGEILSRQWDFGDGNKSSEMNPSYIFRRPGYTYNVSLLVSGPGGMNSTTKEIEIKWPKPVAKFEYELIKNQLNSMVIKFYDKSDGNINTRKWDFGDNTQSNETNPVHIFQEPENTQADNITVSLTVIGEGGEDIVFRNIKYIWAVPKADFIGSPRSGTIPLQVNFINKSVGKINEWLWNFGDNHTSTEENPVHIYEQTGFYTVTLTAIGPGGPDICERKDYITKVYPPLNADFFANPVNGKPPLVVNFSDNSKGEIIKWIWDFGDSKKSLDQTPVHTYEIPGNYTVTLLIEGNNETNKNVKSNYISVAYPEPIANFTASTKNGDLPLKINFTDLSTGIISNYYWQFGDGTYSNIQSPEHIYNDPGIYNVSLKVSGPGGDGLKVCENYINVKWPPPQAKFSAFPVTGVSPLYVSFKDISTNIVPGNIFEWLWDFGDGNKSTQQFPVHKYINPGLYSVSLRVKGKGGEDIEVIQDYIEVNESCPYPGFFAIPITGAAPLKVDFYNTSDGNVTEFLWDFGDGFTSTQKNPKHIFINPGLYNISITAKNQDCIEKVNKEKYINVEWSSPNVDFSASPIEGIAPLLVEFKDLSSNDVKNWLWKFGDETSSESSSQNPIYTYRKPGSYSVTLSVSNPEKFNTLIKQDYILVKSPPPIADFDYTIIRSGELVIVNLTNKSSGEINEYFLDYGDGRTFVDNELTYKSIVYEKSGTYSLSLNVTGPGGQDTKVRKEILIIENPPVARFKASTVEGYSPLTVNFINESQGDYISNYWDFGDTYSSTLQNPVHIFQKPGTYTVSLTVFSANTNDSITMTNMIYVKKYLPVIADFFADHTMGLAPLNVSFFDASTGNILKYEWDFGNNTFSQNKNPQCQYINPGSYTVSLKVTGSKDENIISRLNYITVNEKPPDANFDISKNTGTIPFNVQFYDKSEGNIKTWLWNFGDGQTSQVQNARHTYTKPGTYTVSLFVSGPGGNDQKISINCIKKVYPKINADFSVSSSLGSAPFTVGMKDMSVGLINQWEWNFGDNTFSNDQNPVKTYYIAGTYYISLTVRGYEESDHKTFISPVIVNKQIPAFSYKVDKILPEDKKEWYFNYPSDIGIDQNNNLYISDAFNHTIYKYDLNGNLEFFWGDNGVEYGKFNYPMAIDIDSYGNVYIVDSGNHRIQKFNENGEFIKTWGYNGYKQGEFLWPSDIALDKDENIYICDEKNHRIQKFNNNGEFLLFWGDKGNNNNEFDRPTNIAVDSNGFVFVLDQNNFRIQKFYSNGKYISSISSENMEELEKPSGIAIDSMNNVYIGSLYNQSIIKYSNNCEILKKWIFQNSNLLTLKSQKSFNILNDNIYISDSSNSRIQIFNFQNGYTHDWSSASNDSGKFWNPFGLVLDKNENIYCSDYTNDRVQKFNFKGNFIKKWGEYGSQPGQLKGPAGLDINLSGNIYVADSNNHRISVFSSDSDFLFQWGNFGSEPGNFNYPLSVSINSNKMVYVADTYNHRIQKFDENGQFISQWGQKGNNTYQFEYPSCIAIDENDNIYVLDFGNKRIQIFNKNAIFISQLNFNDSTLLPHSIAVKNQYIYISDIQNNNIQKINKFGKLIAKIGGFGFYPGKLNFPSSLFISKNGNIYVSDMKNNRIQSFRPINLKEAILILQILVNENILFMENTFVDINYDNKIGMAEVLDILKFIVDQ